MGLLADTQNWGLCMRWEWRESFPRHQFQRKPLVNNSGMHHGTWVTHVPWCVSGSLIRDGGKKGLTFLAHAQFFVSNKRPIVCSLSFCSISDWHWEQNATFFTQSGVRGIDPFNHCLNYKWHPLLPLQHINVIFLVTKSQLDGNRYAHMILISRYRLRAVMIYLYMNIWIYTVEYDLFIL